jgi:phosphoribosyl 1,2-cyclic phosphodiesterase
MMRFASLGSGSQGNGLVVEAGATRVLLDCGFGLGETQLRLGRLGLTPEDLDAIIVTHEHDDHIGGVARLAGRHGLPVYLTHGTFSALNGAGSVLGEVSVIDSHHAFAIADIEIQPFPVPHDAREPAQFVFSDGTARLGVLTDVGTPTPHIADTLSGVDALVLECNYDAGMLERGSYPVWLKRRIAGRLGHLDNAAAAELLSELDRTRLQHVIAAHLSQQNNTPDLARRALAGALRCEPGWIQVATQDDGFGWLEIAPR